MNPWKLILPFVAILLLTSACQVFAPGPAITTVKPASPFASETNPAGTIEAYPPVDVIYPPIPTSPNEIVIEDIYPPPKSEEMISLETRLAAPWATLARTSTPGSIQSRITSTPAPTTVTSIKDAVLTYTNANVIYLLSKAVIQPLTGARPGSPIYALKTSFDGEWVAYFGQTEKLGQDIWACKTDGSDEFLLVSQADLAAIDPISDKVLPYDMGWIPNTHLLYFTTSHYLDGQGSVHNNDLNIINVDTLEKRILPLPGEEGRLFFSPDGKQIGLSMPRQIDLINLDGSNYREAALTFELISTYSERLYSPPLYWAADSSELYTFIIPQDSQADLTPPTKVWQIPLDGSPARLITEFTAAPRVVFDTQISPDLSRVAYQTSIGDPEIRTHQLHLLSLDGSSDLRVFSGTDIHFAGWSPDGQHYAFFSGPDYSLLIGDLSGKISLAPDAPFGVYHFAWLNNTHFVYIQKKGESADLMISSLSGPAQLIDSGPTHDLSFSLP